MVKFWVFFCTLSLMSAFTAYVLLTGNTPISFEDIESNFAPWVNDSGKVGTYYAAEPFDTSYPVASNTGSKLNGTLELVSATSPTELSMWAIMFISFIVLLLYAMFALSVIGFYLMNSRGWTKHVEIPHKTMPSLIFAAVVDDNSTSSTCAVCFEDYIVGEKLRVLPCHHTFCCRKESYLRAEYSTQLGTKKTCSSSKDEFHANCVDPWLISWRTICPVCKLDVSVSQRNMLQDVNMEETAEQIIFNLQFKVSSLVRHYFLFQILLFCVIMRVPSKVLCQYTWFLFILSLIASIRAVHILVKMVLELIKRGGEIYTMRSIDDRITWYWKMWRFSLGTMFMSWIICIAVLMLYATWVIPCCGT